MGNGAGILPTTIYKNKLYFLFGKENQYEDSAPGFSDFGGGVDSNESFFQTAIREGGEELTGFLGSDKDLKKMLNKYGTYNIDYITDNVKDTSKKNTYRAHIFPMEYDPLLVHYYNNNQRFLQKRLDPIVIQKSKIFEKAVIKWVCVDDLMKMKREFRFYFKNIVDMIYSQRDKIRVFISKALKTSKNKTRKIKG
jgi:8-oxo-dGTP pyrophosphatase MutT (NUDIX family)